MELKRNLLAGKCMVGTQITMISNPQLVFILKNLGFNFLFIDCEHGGFSTMEVRNMVAMCRALSMGVLVRPPQVDRQNVQIYADLGIDGLIIPMVESAEMMEEVVRHARFAPYGVRGVAPGPITDFKTAEDIGELLRQVNEEFLIVAQIESKAGVEHSEEILSVPGVDAVFFGLNDMSVSYGKPGKVDDPMFKEILAKILCCAREKGKICGHHFFNRNDLEWGLSQGIRLISWRSDMAAMRATYMADMDYISSFTKPINEKRSFFSE